MEISQEVYAAIEKQLSAEAGGIIKNILVQADLDAKEVVSLKAKLKNNEDYTVQLKRDLDNNKIKQSEIEANINRIKDIEKRERKLEIDKLTYQLESEKSKTEFSKQVALGLVRNSDYRTSVFTNETIPYTNKDGYDSLRYPNKSVMETKTID